MVCYAREVVAVLSDEMPAMALSHKPLLLLITCLAAWLGVNRFNDLAILWEAARRADRIAAEIENGHY